MTPEYFTFSGLRFLVKSNQIPPLIWLKEFMSPSFEFSSNSTDQNNIEILHIIDSAKYSEYKKLRSGRKVYFVKVYAMDQKNISLPLLKLNNREIIYDDISEVIYVLERNHSRLLIISTGDNIFSRKGLMRTIREFTINHCLVKNQLIIHGAAVSINGNGIIVTGPKGAGKTTFLLSLMHNKVYNYIANDRVVIRSENKQDFIKGIPTIVNIGKNTLESFTGFREEIIYKNRKYYLSLNEINDLHNKTFKPDPYGNFTLSPLQLCNLLNVTMVQESNLSMLIFISTSTNNDKIKFNDVPSSKATEYLFKNIIGIESEFLNSSIFNIDNKDIKSDNEEIYKKCGEITSNLRCIDCNIGLKNLDYKYIHSELTKFILN